MALLDPTEPIGRLVRRPLRAIPPNTTMRILAPSLWGLRWIAGSGRHAYWLGTYECAKRRLFRSLIRPGNVVYDIGANVGFYTLIASRKVGVDGRVFSFEPLPRNLDFMAQHLTINRVTNASVISAAISDKSGRLKFLEGPDSASGRLSARGEIEVAVIAVDDFVSDHPPPSLVKMDIEGGEMMALRGAYHTMSVIRPQWLVATHGTTMHSECVNMFRNTGYFVDVIEVTGNERWEILARPSPSSSHQ